MSATELWADVNGFVGFYQVSNLGRVRSLDRVSGGQVVAGQIMGTKLSGRGYRSVALRSAGGVRVHKMVHRLVAAAFVPNPEFKPIVNHIDNDPLNNRAENLEWCTQAENLSHMTNQGRRASPWAGKRSPRASLSDEVVASIRAMAASGVASASKIGAAHGCSKTIVQRILSGKAYATPSNEESQTHGS